MQLTHLYDIVLLHDTRETCFLRMESADNFLPEFMYWWNDFISMNNILWTLLPPKDDKVWNTACVANDRNVVMTESVNNFIW